MHSTQKKKVAVLRGGPSSEYEVSLKTGASVLKNLPEKYIGIDVLIDKDGVWHIDGFPVDPKNLHLKADVAFIAMHGKYGEDGTVQKILETWHMPFTGSKALASAIGMNKALAKDVFTKHGIKTPRHKLLRKELLTDIKKIAHELYTTFTQPSVVKPATAGSSVGVSLVYSLKDMEAALEKAKEHGDILIEELIKGKEATVGVLEKFRGKDFYSLIPVEIRPRSQSFFDYEAKYSDTAGADEICPGTFSRQETEELERLAVAVHKALGARHYSRTDFMVHPKRGIFALEINTLPGLTAQSLLPKEMIAVGSSYGELLEHLIELALKK